MLKQNTSQPALVLPSREEWTHHLRKQANNPGWAREHLSKSFFLETSQSKKSWISDINCRSSRYTKCTPYWLQEIHQRYFISDTCIGVGPLYTRYTLLEIGITQGGASAGPPLASDPVEFKTRWELKISGSKPFSAGNRPIREEDRGSIDQSDMR